jgi:hypothetical protein
LRLALVLDAQVDALHYHAALVSQNVNDLSAPTFVFQTPADNLNGITFFDLYFHGVNSNTT